MNQITYQAHFAIRWNDATKKDSFYKVGFPVEDSNDRGKWTTEEVSELPNKKWKQMFQFQTGLVDKLEIFPDGNRRPRSSDNILLRPNKVLEYSPEAGTFMTDWRHNMAGARALFRQDVQGTLYGEPSPLSPCVALCNTCVTMSCHHFSP